MTETHRVRSLARCWFALVLLLPCALQAQVQKLELDAPAFAPERIHVTVYLPPDYGHSTARYPVLYADDGQDMQAVGLQPTLAKLYGEHAIEPVIVVAIDMLRDRASGYGLSDRQRGQSVVGGSRIGAIGLRAADYSAWVATSLVPTIDAHYRTRADARQRTVMGWSLGALNAFNLGWQYPDVFGQVGAMSPSFWLAGDRSDADAVQRSRLAQAMVDRGPKRQGMRFWFAAGTAEETNDRDHDGVIDVIDDLKDLIDGWHANGAQRRGLRQLGYSTTGTDADVTVFLLSGGHHQQASWAKMLPVFLRWAFPATPRP
ncbi:alpha/beta hydrolase [Frateuria terrea]|uniref:Enterochelin esterase n=1 Tax=Frateuria terrea TaxID=529704 RepID=A0A1H6U9X8_9GAMM|nr:alpha/beta hydrolase-fold protein [Frateuria terrea]SEI86437.1 Enterochelin esterase [Frateuria terrea]SFP38850.1 Enterochelin esterase [Frateuria terrea]